MDMQETARALFGRSTPEPTPEPADQPISAPVIPGQERMPPPQNKSTTSQFIDNLFNN